MSQDALMFAVQLALGLTAIYCGGAWLFLAVRAWRIRKALNVNADARREIAELTFRLGLCFIHACGFLGLLLY